MRTPETPDPRHLSRRRLLAGGAAALAAAGGHAAGSRRPSRRNGSRRWRRRRGSAARVLINWLLTKEAQAAWARELQTNSRFVGVEPGDPHTVVPPGVSLTPIDAEELLPELVKTQDLARQLIK